MPAEGTSPRGSWLWWPGLVGVLVGAGAKYADLTSGPLGTIGSFFGPWVVLVVLFARRSPSRALGSASGAVLMLAALVGYYAAYRILDGDVDLIVVAFWVGAALTAAPVLAAVVTYATRAGWAGAVAAATPGGLLLGEAARSAVRAADAGPSAVGFWSLVALDLVAGTWLLLGLPIDARTRTCGVALAPLSAVAGFFASDLQRLFVVLVLRSP